MTTTTERDELDRLAKKYEDQGYEVVTGERPVELLPEKLRFFSPDLILRKGDENIIVEIKTKGVTASRDQLVRIAEAVNHYPNWQLYIHLFEPEATADRVTPSDAAIRDAVANAKRLFDANERGAALLLLWSAFEAAGAQALGREGVDVLAPWEPEALSLMLAHHGLIGDDEYERLVEVRNVRNLLAHGGLETEIDDGAFRYLAGLATRLLDEPQAVDA